MSDDRRAAWRDLVLSYDEDSPAATLVLARRYLASYPEDGAAWLILGDRLSDLARYAEAARVLRKAAKLLPPDRIDMAYAQLGHLYKEKGNPRLAEKWYRRAVESNPRARNWVFLGAILAKQGRYPEAKECHLKAVKAGGPDESEAHLNLGLILRAEERWDEALTCFDEALRLDPEYVAASRARADVVEAIRLFGSRS